MSRLT